MYFVLEITLSIIQCCQQVITYISLGERGGVAVSSPAEPMEWDRALWSWNEGGNMAWESILLRGGSNIIYK